MKHRLTVIVLALLLLGSLISNVYLADTLEEHLDADRQVAAAGPRISEDGHVYHYRTNR